MSILYDTFTKWFKNYRKKNVVLPSSWGFVSWAPPLTHDHERFSQISLSVLPGALSGWWLVLSAPATQKSSRGSTQVTAHRTPAGAQQQYIAHWYM